MNTKLDSPRFSSPAPWAEVVPGTRLMTVDDFSALEEDEWRPGDSTPSATVDESGMLDGEEVVPDFTYPMERLFA